MDIFRDEILDTFIFNIPHASINIPDIHNYTDLEELDNDILKLTDWCTDIIFEVDQVDFVRANFSRMFCDIERFRNDDEEIMSKYGRGVYYTHSDNGNEIRKN